MVMILHASLSFKAARVFIKVAFIVAQLFLFEIVTAIYFVHQALAQGKLLLLEDLSLLGLS